MSVHLRVVFCFPTLPPYLSSDQCQRSASGENYILRGMVDGVNKLENIEEPGKTLENAPLNQNQG